METWPEIDPDLWALDTYTGFDSPMQVGAHVVFVQPTLHLSTDAMVEMIS